MVGAYGFWSWVAENMIVVVSRCCSVVCRELDSGRCVRISRAEI